MSVSLVPGVMWPCDTSGSSQYCVGAAKDVGSKDCFLFSSADDQLGYDPPEREAPAVEHYSPNDEALFTISPKLGDTITRTLLAEARSLGFTLTDPGPRSPGPQREATIREVPGCRQGDPLANAENAKWLKVIKPCIVAHGVVSALFPPRWWGRRRLPIQR
jgi:hypothetical protein